MKCKTFYVLRSIKTMRKYHNSNNTNTKHQNHDNNEQSVNTELMGETGRNLDSCFTM